MNQQQIAKMVDKLAGIKADQAALDFQADLLVTQLKKLGGGESRRWEARIVKMQERLVVVKAHKQLRLYSKEKQA